MNKANLYHQNKNNSVVDSQIALQNWASVFKWRSNGCDSVLDAGCGSGDVTFEVLLPFLPTNFKRLVGVDISNEMIKYARKSQIHPKLSFEQFDLCSDLEKQPFNSAKSFDHIFSFNTIHRVPDKKKCIQNFYKLLGSNGDLLLLFAANHPIYDAYKEQSFDERWASYMVDVDKITPSYQHSKNPAKEFRELLIECGFTECDVRVNEKNFLFKNNDMLRGKLKFHQFYNIFMSIN